MDALYTARVTSQGGREGRVTSSDGVLDLALAIPVELGGPGGTASNPEQLFAAGYAACFESTLRGISSLEKIELGECQVTAALSICHTPDGMFGHKAQLVVHLPELDPAQALDLMQRAHRYCPYSKATRGNMEVLLELG
jgi:Ohr subfamily peroxiredoxin